MKAGTAKQPRLIKWMGLNYHYFPTWLSKKTYLWFSAFFLPPKIPLNSDKSVSPLCMHTVRMPLYISANLSRNAKFHLFLSSTFIICLSIVDITELLSNERFRLTQRWDSWVPNTTLYSANAFSKTSEGKHGRFIYLYFSSFHHLWWRFAFLFLAARGPCDERYFYYNLIYRRCYVVCASLRQRAQL